MLTLPPTEHIYRMRHRGRSHSLHDPSGEVVLVLLNVDDKRAEIVCECCQEAYDLGRAEGGGR
jgi:hypothetical protein